MTIDTAQPLSGGPRPEWDLPEILDIQTRHISFKANQPRHFKSALAEYKEAVEFMVHTSGPVPARALGAALFVGDVQVTESQQADNNLYRFLAFDLDRLKPGAPIRWGWINTPKEQQQGTRFRYEESR
jgi:hypothetical protein